MVPASGSPPRSPLRGRVAWGVAAAALFGVATALLYAPLLGHDLHEVVPTAGGPARGTRASEWDRRFAVWLIARDADAWLHHPWRLFDTGTCHPVKSALALGHPALSVGLLGVPGMLASGDPVVSYDTALLLQTLLAAFAMYWLVADWTGERAAGLAAGLAYAFLPGKTDLVAYPFHGDTAWTLLALLLARRLWTGGGVAVALGLAAALALQMSASFYTFLVAVCLCAPTALWLARSHGRARLRPLPAALACALVAAAAVWIFAPFLGERGTALAARRVQVFGSLSMLPSQLFGSVAVGLLALAGLCLPRRWCVPALPSHPRLALASGAGAAVLLATARPLYAALARILPGLENVRVPLILLGGLHLAWCLLAGLGTAGLLRMLPASARRPAALLAVALVFVDVLRPPLPGVPPRRGYAIARVRPPDAEIAFFRELASMGNRGPLLETPIDERPSLQGFDAASRAVLLQAYHRRRTSACYNSFLPDAVRALAPLAARLPDERALDALAAQGFTTLIVHRPLRRADRDWQRRIARAAAEGRGLTPILSRGGLSAYALRSEQRDR